MAEVRKRTVLKFKPRNPKPDLGNSFSTGTVRTLLSGLDERCPERELTRLSGVYRDKGSVADAGKADAILLSRMFENECLPLASVKVLIEHGLIREARQAALRQLSPDSPISMYAYAVANMASGNVKLANSIADNLLMGDLYDICFGGLILAETGSQRAVLIAESFLADAFQDNHRMSMEEVGFWAFRIYLSLGMLDKALQCPCVSNKPVVDRFGVYAFSAVGNHIENAEFPDTRNPSARALLMIETGNLWDLPFFVEVSHYPGNLKAQSELYEFLMFDIERMALGLAPQFSFATLAVLLNRKRAIQNKRNIEQVRKLCVVEDLLSAQPTDMKTILRVRSLLLSIPDDIFADYPMFHSKTDYMRMCINAALKSDDPKAYIFAARASIDIGDAEMARQCRDRLLKSGNMFEVRILTRFIQSAEMI